MKDYSNISETELLKLSKLNDDYAVSELVTRYQNFVKNELQRLNAKEEITDLTQEVLFKMVMSVHQLKEPQKFHFWLKQIVHNVFYDNLRKNRIKNTCPISEPNCDNENSVFGECVIDKRRTPAENTLHCELKTKINIAIEKLPELFKTIVLLREVEGLSYDEIADITHLNVGTVKSRLSRARGLLKKELENYVMREN